MKKQSVDSSSNPLDIGFISNFFKLKSAGGILLILSALAAIILANSPLHLYVERFFFIPLSIQIGDSFHLNIAKPLLLWINDGLMAFFFLLVGLELKREFIEGELANPRNIIMPILGAIGGMLIPILLYTFFNAKDPVAIKGWAIPAATDIAFALGILSLLGSKVPISLKVFIGSIAIFDDIGAILIIALFYTSKLSLLPLIITLICVILLFLVHRLRIRESCSPYFFLGLIMWAALLKSGVHATLTGVLVSLFIPIQAKRPGNQSLLHELEHELYPVVTFVILPLFAFANSGLRFIDISFSQMTDTVSIGIVCGLCIGKPLGIMTFAWLGSKLKLYTLPKNLTWSLVFSASILCGIGFTMSLFVGSLAFENQFLVEQRLGILFGSLISGVIGYSMLKRNLQPDH